MTPAEREGESHSQEARKLYQEARRIKYVAKVRNKGTEISFAGGWGSASKALQSFIFERGGKVTEWNQIVGILREKAEKDEKKKKQRVLLKEELEVMMQEVLEEVIAEEQARSRRRNGGRTWGKSYRTVVCYMWNQGTHSKRMQPKVQEGEFE